MKVNQIMTTEPRTCSPGTTVAAAASLMWDGDCGILPVVEEGKIVGIVTDRDMFIALATRNKLASQMSVGEVASETVATCEPEDDVHVVLATMRNNRVRRVPVVGFGGTVLGIVSMDDILLATGPNEAVRDEEVVDTLRAICAPHRPVPQVVLA